MVKASDADDEAPVVWCADFDVARLSDPAPLTKPDIWPDYCSFFRHLLELDEKERREGNPAEQISTA